MTTHHPVAPAESYLSLGQLVERLAAVDPALVVPLGFANPHSFRGDYSELAFEPVADIRVGDMLDAARSAVNATFSGYKGGDYLMTENASCWIADEGSSSDNQIGPILLDLIIASARLPVDP